MSLINREDLIAEYDRVHVGPPGGARKLIVDAPEVVSEIIRCKDCKYHRQNYAGDSWCGHPKGLDGFELMPTDFCSAAERRTNERKTE